MKWFIIIVMTTQLNAVGKEETPLWIPYLQFSEYEECMTFARNNQINLFRKSVQAYKGEILPTKLNCVNEDIMREIGQTYGGVNEKDI
tara:strand:- start:475 stop:738 length:264 start_codon:yes stop_codon:yes gene_type:complete